MAEDGPPVVAVVGRQNVGKSTLVNRLIGGRVAISHESPGVTRDRVATRATWGDRTFVVVDTGGFTLGAAGLELSVAAQADRAVAGADLILLVVDAATGIQEEDAELARRLRRSSVGVLLVANKVDSEAQEAGAAEFQRLGLGEPFAVSALHGRGSGDLLGLIESLLPAGETLPQPDVEAKFALVGRPNVGKSSLFNRLVGETRTVVHETPGTTRDAVDSEAEIAGRRVRFVDTAGLRRQVKTRDVEYYGLVRSLRAIDASDVALLVVDASEGATAQDKRIAARAEESGRGLAVALNKWDLVPSQDRADRFLDLKERFSVFPGTPVMRLSALTGSGVHKVGPALLRVHAAWSGRAATAEVNRVLRRVVGAHPPPRGAGRVLYATQASAGPPTFVVFGLSDPGRTYRRYLENALRRTFHLEGVPVRIGFRARHAKHPPSRRPGGG